MDKFSVYPTKELHLFTSLVSILDTLANPGIPVGFGKSMDLIFYDGQTNEQNNATYKVDGFTITTNPIVFDNVGGTDKVIYYDPAKVNVTANAGNKSYTIVINGGVPGDVTHVKVRWLTEFAIIRVHIHAKISQTLNIYDLWFGDTSFTTYGTTDKSADTNPNSEGALTVFAKFDNNGIVSTEPFINYGDITYHPFLEIIPGTANRLTLDTAYPCRIIPSAAVNTLPQTLSAKVQLKYGFVARQPVTPDRQVLLKMDPWPLNLPKKGLLQIHPATSYKDVSRDPSQAPLTHFLFIAEGFTHANGDVFQAKITKLKDELIKNGGFNGIKDDIVIWLDMPDTATESAEDGISIVRPVCNHQTTVPGGQDYLILSPSSFGDSVLYKTIMARTGLNRAINTGEIKSDNFRRQNAPENPTGGTTSYPTYTYALTSITIPNVFNTPATMPATSEDTHWKSSGGTPWALFPYFGESGALYNKPDTYSHKAHYANGWLNSRIDGVLRNKNSRFGCNLGTYRLSEGGSQDYKNDYSDVFAGGATPPAYKQENEWFIPNDEALDLGFDIRKFGGGKRWLSLDVRGKYINAYLSRLTADPTYTDTNATIESPANGAFWTSDSLYKQVTFILNTNFHTGVTDAYCHFGIDDVLERIVRKSGIAVGGFLYDYDPVGFKRDRNQTDQLDNQTTADQKNNPLPISFVKGFIHEIGHKAFLLKDEYEDSRGQGQKVDNEDILSSNIVAKSIIQRPDKSIRVEKIPWGWDRIESALHIKNIQILFPAIGQSYGDYIKTILAKPTDANSFDLDGNGTFLAKGVIEIELYKPSPDSIDQWQTYDKNTRVCIRSKELVDIDRNGFYPLIYGKNFEKITFAYLKTVPNTDDAKYNQYFLYLNHYVEDADLGKLDFSPEFEMHVVYTRRRAISYIDQVVIIQEGSKYAKNKWLKLTLKNANGKDARVRIKTDKDGKITTSSPVEFLPKKTDTPLIIKQITNRIVPEKKKYPPYLGSNYAGDFEYQVKEHFKGNITKEQNLMAKLRLKTKRFDTGLSYISLTDPGFNYVDATKIKVLCQRNGDPVDATQVEPKFNPVLEPFGVTGITIGGGGKFWKESAELNLVFYSKKYYSEKIKNWVTYTGSSDQIYKKAVKDGRIVKQKVLAVGTGGALSLIDQHANNYLVKPSSLNENSNYSDFYQYYGFEVEYTDKPTTVTGHKPSIDFKYLFYDGTDWAKNPDIYGGAKINWHDHGSGYILPKKPIKVYLIRDDKKGSAMGVAFPVQENDTALGKVVVIDGDEGYVNNQNITIVPQDLKSDFKKGKALNVTLAVGVATVVNGQVVSVAVGTTKGNCYAAKTSGIYSLEAFIIGQCDKKAKLDIPKDAISVNSDNTITITKIDITEPGKGYQVNILPNQIFTQVLVIGGSDLLYTKLSGGADRTIDNNSTLADCMSGNGFNATVQVGACLKGIDIISPGSNFYYPPTIKITQTDSPSGFREAKVQAFINEYETLIPNLIRRHINTIKKGYLEKMDNSLPYDFTPGSTKNPSLIDLLHADGMYAALKSPDPAKIPDARPGPEFPIAIYEGANSYNTGSYRATVNSIMRSDFDFNDQSNKAMLDADYSLVSKYYIFNRINPQKLALIDSEYDRTIIWD